MTCLELASLLATSTLRTLTGDRRAAAEAHLAQCAACREFVAALEGPEPVSTAAPRFAPPDLTPVPPIPGLGTFAAVCAAIVAAALSVTAGILGVRGWHGMNQSQVLATVLFFATAFAALIFGMYAQFKPGSQIKINDGIPPLALSVGFALLTVLFFPWDSESRLFAINALGCTAIGSWIALVSAAGMLWTIRRGYALDTNSAGIWTGAVSSLAGIAGLQIFCAHRGAEHMLAGHLPVVAVAAIACVLIVRGNLLRPVR